MDINDAFDIFDVYRTGLIDKDHLLAALRALGFEIKP